VIDDATTDSLNVAVRAVVLATPVELGDGDSLVTVGATAAAVVKDQANGEVMVFPAASLIPLIVAVYELA